jgi:molybdopterin converting factor small subunit
MPIKITVEFLSLPIVAKAIGSKSIHLNRFQGETVQDLVTHLTTKYGKTVRDFLLDDNGDLDMSFRIQLNGATWIHQDGLDHPLADGDQVTLMLLVGGG